MCVSWRLCTEPGDRQRQQIVDETDQQSQDADADEMEDEALRKNVGSSKEAVAKFTDYGTRVLIVPETRGFR